MDFRSFAKSVRDALLRGLPWVLAAVGAACILAGYLLVDPMTHKTLQNILTGFGQAILVGGVFGAVLKSFQFMGVFRDAVVDLIFENRFLTIRKDLPGVWQSVTTAMCQEKFPELSDRLHGAIIKDYLLVDKNYYYSKYHRKCCVDWQDKKLRKLKMVEELDITIIPVNEHEEIEYKFKYIPTENVSLEINHPIVEELIINGRDHKNAGRPVGNAYVYNIRLQHENKYDIYRRSTRIWPVDVDPYSRYLSTNFVLDTYVRVECIPSDVRVRFLPLGTLGDFEKRGARVGHPARAGDVDMEYKELLFPRQGYILFFQVVKDDAESVYPDERLQPEPVLGELEPTEALRAPCVEEGRPG